MLIHDQPDQASQLQTYLRDRGLNCQIFHCDGPIQGKIEQEKPDITLIYLSQSHQDGLSVCRQIRDSYPGLILLIAPVQDPIDEIVSLEIGADDYIAAPINLRLLLARIHNLLRRGAHQQAPEISLERTALQAELTIGELRLNKAELSCCFRGEWIPLSGSEFQVLCYLADHENQLISREQILLHTRRIDYDGLDRSIDVAIARIRKHFAHISDMDMNQAILTIRTQGYMFNRLLWE